MKPVLIIIGTFVSIAFLYKILVINFVKREMKKEKQMLWVDSIINKILNESTEDEKI